VKYRVKRISQLPAVKAYKTMTSVVKPQVEAAHLVCVSVVEPHARGPMAADRYANGRYAALRVRGYMSHGAACVKEQSFPTVSTTVGLPKSRTSMEGSSHMQLPFRKHLTLLHLSNLSSQFPCLFHPVLKSFPPDNTVRIPMLPIEQLLAGSMLVPRHSRLPKE